MTDQAQLANLVDEVVTELPAWLPGQRWFAGKDRPVTDVRPVSWTLLRDGDPMLLHVIVEVIQDDRSERYQLLIGCGTQLPDHLGASWLGTEEGLLCYEATGDADLTGTLLDLMVDGQRVGPLTFEHEPDVTLTGDLRARPVIAEQSNTSLVFGSQYILKLYRKLAPGLNPDLKLHRALRGVGSDHIAPPLGSISGDLGGTEPTTVAMLQQFVGDAVDGWAMATTSVRDLMAEPDLGASEVGGDFAGEAQRLGHAVATVHAELRTALGQHEVDANEFDRTVAAMARRLDEVAGRVPELVPMVPSLRAAFERIREVKAPVYMQFIHGDLHLGQVLRTANGWLLIDFEGEPAAPPAERGVLRSPLRDVAGMLRSFDYAAHQMLIGQSVEDDQLTESALEWARRNRAAFCDGYAEVDVESIGDPRTHGDLLRAFELDKAVYEVAYEHANRPEWLAVPLSSISRLTAGGE
ncbi:MAG TPA: aminoglycoside phosphotransferase [Pseudonocardiaceae bacterium]|nr:aminoglycoside phosphotransferase [Pseudonocardiaceae bacterium]